jgi:hypothetical protein
MMRGSRARQGLALLLVPACAAALIAANDAQAEVTTVARPFNGSGCQATAGASTNAQAVPPANLCLRRGAPDANANGQIDAGNVNACADPTGGIAGALNPVDRNTAQARTGANTAGGMDDAAGPDNTAKALTGKPPRGTILGRSWRQIFPRAN